MFQTKDVEKIETHILRSIFFFLNRPFYEVMWRNVVERCRPQMTIRRMRSARWISKVTNTHSQCVIFIALPLQKLLHKRVSMLRHTYTACLVNFIICCVLAIYILYSSLTL